jgi:hypothetical protein
MQPRRWCHCGHAPHHMGCCGSRARGLFGGPVAVPLSCGVVGVAMVLSLSARRRLCCGCRCARSYCSPSHRNTVSVLKIEREKKVISQPRRWSPRSPASASFLSSPSPPWRRRLFLSLRHLASLTHHGGFCSCSVQVCLYIIIS